MPQSSSDPHSCSDTKPPVDDLEKDHQALRHSIEQAKHLSRKSEEILFRHRNPVAAEAGDLPPL